MQALFTLSIHSPIALNASGHLGSQLYMKNPRIVNSLANIDGFSLGPVVRIVTITKGMPARIYFTTSYKLVAVYSI